MEKPNLDSRERIDALLKDDLVQAVMRADGIGESETRIVWCAAATRVRRNRQPADGPLGSSRSWDSPWTAGWRERLTAYGPGRRPQLCGQE